MTSTANPSVVLHYIFDPLCGWCYAAAPALKFLQAQEGVEVVLAPTGLFAGAGAWPMDAQFAAYAWAYAAAPLVKAARTVPGVAVQWHAGGMLTGQHTRVINEQFREYVLPHDKRIEEMTGQPFGEAYTDGLLRAVGSVLDSEPPTTALLAAEQLAGLGLEMLGAEQKAYYVDGLLISDREVLVKIAADLGLPAEQFEAAYMAMQGQPTQ